MVSWNNLDTLASYKELEAVQSVNLAEVMTGENGAERVKKYSIKKQHVMPIALKGTYVTCNIPFKILLHVTEPMATPMENSNKKNVTTVS